jgi:hypothetical protein
MLVETLEQPVAGRIGRVGDDENLYLVGDASAVDAINAEFYGRFPYPWRPTNFLYPSHGALASAMRARVSRLGRHADPEAAEDVGRRMRDESGGLHGAEFSAGDDRRLDCRSRRWSCADRRCDRWDCATSIMRNESLNAVPTSRSSTSSSAPA